MRLRSWAWTAQAEKEEGQALPEYALIIAFVSVIVIAVLVLLGPQMSSFFNTVSNSL